MNSKTTGIWFVIAAALALFIYVFQHFLQPVISGPSKVLPQLNSGLVTGIQVIPMNAPEISVIRTNGNWYLDKPLFYPGQTASIESLLDALKKLVPTPRITATEMREHKNAEAEFGFDKPLTLIIEAENARWQLVVGNKTAPGNQVYLRVEGIDGAFVVDADWLKWIPHSAGDWRDTSLVKLENNPDSILLTNGAQGLVIELHRDPTNHFWRMLHPLQARADTAHVDDALRQLQSARVTQFVTDNPKAELSTYGLQPAEMNLWIGAGTNFSTGLSFGQSASDDSSQIYAKRAGWSAILKTAKELLAPWYGTVNSFRDTNLLELTALPEEIEMRFADTNDNFILVRQDTNHWTLAGKKFPADTESAQMLAKDLVDLHITEFAKDTLTPTDLAAYGLDNPAQQIILRAATGETNPLVELNFGNTESNKVFVRRSDEPFVYAISWTDFHHLPTAAWELRDRHIWNFSTNDVAQVTIHQNGKTRQILRKGMNQWSLAAGSQGIIVGSQIEQAVQQLSQLSALGWLGVNYEKPEVLGFTTNNLQVTAELKDGKKFTVDFGQEVKPLQSSSAMVTLDGDRWTFVMEPEIYLFVSTYLTIPPNVP